MNMKNNAKAKLKEKEQYAKAKLEKELLQKKRISKEDIKEDIVALLGEEDDSIDSKADDKINKYKKLFDIYGETVFTWDDEAKVISLHKDFKAIEEYLYCLACHLLTEKEKSTIKDKFCFEKIVGEALKVLFGKDSHYEITDAHYRNLIKNTDSDNKNLIKDIAEKMNEEFVQKIETGKDAACDIVFWKCIEKSLGSNIVVLAQCKTGNNWKDGKSVYVDFWRTLIIFSIPPIKAFAITDLVVDRKDIRRCTKQRGLFLDRASIIKILSNQDNEGLQKIRADISQLELGQRLEEEM